MLTEDLSKLETPEQFESELRRLIKEHEPAMRAAGAMHDFNVQINKIFTMKEALAKGINPAQHRRALASALYDFGVYILAYSHPANLLKELAKLQARTYQSDYTKLCIAEARKTLRAQLALFKENESLIAGDEVQNERSDA